MAYARKILAVVVSTLFLLTNILNMCRAEKLAVVQAWNAGAARPEPGTHQQPTPRYTFSGCITKILRIEEAVQIWP